MQNDVMAGCLPVFPLEMRNVWGIELSPCTLIPLICETGASFEGCWGAVAPPKEKDKKEKKKEKKEKREKGKKR